MTSFIRERLYPTLAASILIVVTTLVCLAVIAGPTLMVRRRIGRAGVRIMLACIGVPFRVRGLEHVPTAHCIAVCNHASYLDGIILTAALPPQYTFVVQDGAAGWPLVGLTLKRMGVVFVNRAAARESARLTRQLMRRLHHGESLAIFAEGTFKPEPGLLPFKAGAFLMAAREQALVVPGVIVGTRQVYGCARKLPRWAPISVTFHPPLRADGTDRDAAMNLRERVRGVILGHCGEPDTAPPSDPPAAPSTATESEAAA